TREGRASPAPTKARKTQEHSKTPTRRTGVWGTRGESNPRAQAEAYATGRLASDLSGSVLITGASQVVTLRGGGPRRGNSLSKIGLIKNGAVLVRDGKIVAAGARGDVERRAE